MEEFQACRLMMEYAGIPFEEKEYKARPVKVKKETHWDFSEWEWAQKSLGFDFPQLPYLVIGDFKVTDAAAV